MVCTEQQQKVNAVSLFINAKYNVDVTESSTWFSLDSRSRCILQQSWRTSMSYYDESNFPIETFT